MLKEDLTQATTLAQNHLSELLNVAGRFEEFWAEGASVFITLSYRFIFSRVKQYRVFEIRDGEVVAMRIKEEPARPT